MTSPNEIAKKELWTAVSMDSEMLVLMKTDIEKIREWAAKTDGCVEIEDWHETEGLTIGLKGTEGLRKFGGLLNSRLNGGGRPRGKRFENVRKRFNEERENQNRPENE